MLIEVLMFGIYFLSIHWYAEQIGSGLEGGRR